MSKRNDKFKKLTLEELISKKEQIQETKKKFANIYIKRLDSYITIAKPDSVLISDCLNIENGFESDKHLVYYSVVEPNIKDKELQKAYGCVEPKDILGEILEDGEISMIAQELMKLAGYEKDNVAVVDNLKN